MSQPIITPKIFLTHRDQLEDVLRYQVWADGQLHHHLSRVRHCVKMVRLGRMTTGGARERLAIIARAMHAAVGEFAAIAKAFFDPSRQTLNVRHRQAVPVLHGSSESRPNSSWRKWQWQATHPAAGCLAFSASDWQQQRAVAEVWIQRNVHCCLVVRATGECLALRMDGLDRADTMAEELQAQLKASTESFWTNFTMDECAGLRRHAILEPLAA